MKYKFRYAGRLCVIFNSGTGARKKKKKGSQWVGAVLRIKICLIAAVRPAATEKSTLRAYVGWRQGHDKCLEDQASLCGWANFFASFCLTHVVTGTMSSSIT